MNDVSLAFKCPIYESAQGCAKCTFNYDVLVNAQAYPNPSAPAADHFLKTQPESGYTYEFKR